MSNYSNYIVTTKEHSTAALHIAAESGMDALVFSVGATSVGDEWRREEVATVQCIAETSDTLTIDDIEKALCGSGVVTSTAFLPVGTYLVPPITEFSARITLKEKGLIDFVLRLREKFGDIFVLAVLDAKQKRLQKILRRIRIPSWSMEE